MVTDEGPLEGTEYDGLEDADHGWFETHDKADTKLIGHSHDSALEDTPNSITAPLIDGAIPL